MGGLTWSFALSLLALGCSVAAVVLNGRRTPSAFAQQAQKIAQEAMGKWQTEAKLFEATRDRWTAEFQGIAERCDEILDRTESKRRRIAASTSRANGGSSPQAEADPFAGRTREEIIDAGRRMVRGR